MRNNRFWLLLFVFLLQLGSTSAEDFKVICQVTGFVKTNCYLIYDFKSKEAAIIDPGWQVDTIINFIKENNLNLKYIFLTHGHTDHSFYVSDLKSQFPKVKLCVNKIDFKKMFTQLQWFKKNYGQEFIENERRIPEHKAYMDFDPRSIGIPDIFVKNNQSYKLGS
ncbi:MAG: MBL fold metallo-hydrolase, partial [Bacteroidales bacterium]